MALDQSMGMWAAYQSDPTKAFKGGQWIENTDPATQPGHGTSADTKGYYALVGGKPVYKTYADLAGEGLGAPRTIAATNQEGVPGSGVNQLQGNDAMLSKYPMYDPKESFFAPFMGAFKDLAPFAAMTGLGGGLNALFSGGSFMGGAGGILGDAWKGLSGGNSLLGPGDVPLNQYAGATGGVNAGGVEFVNEGGNVSYDPFEGMQDWQIPSSGSGYDPFQDFQNLSTPGSQSPLDAGGPAIKGLLEKFGPEGLKKILSTPGLLGAALGALGGGLSANGNPAGTTTTVQDVPDWLKPYLIGNLNDAGTARAGLLNSPQASPAALTEYLKTIRGDYLDPSSNPFLDATYRHSADLVGAGVDSRFSAAGRYGSGAHQGVLTEGFNNLATNIFGGNYQAERGRQDVAIRGAPAFDTGRSGAAYSPYTGYADLFPSNARATTSPYFSNTTGGILSGALAGSQLAKLFA